MMSSLYVHRRVLLLHRSFVRSCMFRSSPRAQVSQGFVCDSTNSALFSTIGACNFSGKTNTMCNKYISTTSVFFDNKYQGLAYAITYDKHGDPRTVLEKTPIDLRTPIEADEVILRMLAAPINPADINMIEGVYGIQPELPAVAGSEGVAQVISCGENVKHLKSGDWVLPEQAAWGTWRTHVVAKVSELRKIPNSIPLTSAATLKVNPCTAYRMLRDFVSLDSGDVIIQNCANSGVGRAVIQIANSMNLTTINIVRDRENFAELEEELKNLGASYVITEEFCRSPKMRDFSKDHPKPKLALNGAGGKSATEMLRYLKNKGTMVTYGGMSKQPITIPTGVMIFKDVRVVGFWMSRWKKEHPMGTPENEEMISNIIDLIENADLKPPTSNLTPLTTFEEAVAKAMTPKTGMKQIIFMEQYDKN